VELNLTLREEHMKGTCGQGAEESIWIQEGGKGKKKVKQSRYTPWRRLRGEEIFQEGGSNRKLETTA
jgi:hypothetical protein